MWQQLVALDHSLQTWVVTHRLPSLDQPMLLLSAVGWLGLCWLFIATVLAAFRRLAWRDVGGLALALATAVLLSDYVLKPAIHRARPFLTTPAIRVIGPLSPRASFPSGHAAATFAGAVVLGYIVPEARLVWWLLAVAIAYSRLYLGVHYPLDVMAGAAIGAVCGALTCRVLLHRVTRRSPGAT